VAWRLAGGMAASFYTYLWLGVASHLCCLFNRRNQRLQRTIGVALALNGAAL